MTEPTLTPEAAGKLSMEGWLISLIATGYEKGCEMTTAIGATVTVYQNEAKGKICILVFFPGKNEWISLYPMGGFWKGMHHYFDIHPGSKWVERTPDEMMTMFNEEGTPDAIRE